MKLGLNLSLLVAFTFISRIHGDSDHFGANFWKVKEPELFETKFNFMVSGRNLKLDGHTQINPQLSIFYKSFRYDLNNQTSEVIRHSVNPDWMTVFKSSFDGLDPDQDYHFKVKSIEDNGPGSLIGETKMFIQKIWAIVEAEGEATLPLTSGNGHLIVTKAETITFNLAATNLAKRDTFGGKSDPYVKCLWSRGPDGPEVEFYRTPWIGNVVDAQWNDIISFPAYQRGTDQYLHFKVYDDDGITSDDSLGEAFLKVDDHFKGEFIKRRVIILQNEPKKSGTTGTLIITFQQTAQPKASTNFSPTELKELFF